MKQQVTSPSKRKTKGRARARESKRQKYERQKFLTLLITMVICILTIIAVALISKLGFYQQNIQTSDTVPQVEFEEEVPIEPNYNASPEQETKPSPQAQNAEPEVIERARLAIVIDDVGYNLNHLQNFLDLPIALSFAVLPQLDYSQQSVAQIIAEGKEAILHLPMESHANLDPGPGALLETMTEEEIRSTIEANLATVQGVIGINNHMGSKGSENERIVNWVLQGAEERSLFFLDSRTTANSLFPEQSQEYRVPFAERDVFLDNEHDYTEISRELERGKQIASEKGQAILIGHVGRSELANLLADEYQNIINEGFEFVGISNLVQN